LKLNIMPLCTCSAMWQCAIHGPGLDTSNSMSMLAFYADNFGLIDLGRPVDVEYGRLRAATERLGRPIPATTCGSPHRRRAMACRSSP
jgi:hypothetical protein